MPQDQISRLLTTEPICSPYLLTLFLNVLPLLVCSRRDYTWVFST